MITNEESLIVHLVDEYYPDLTWVEKLTFLRDLSDVLNAMIAGEKVYPCELEEIERFFSFISTETLRRTSNPGCTTIRL